MDTSKLRSFLLLQINDTQFPIGSYSHSYGLETYIQKEEVNDAASFADWLEHYLVGNYLYNDFLAADLAYQKAFDLADLLRLSRLLQVSRSPAELRSAAEKLGNRFYKTLKAMELPADLSLLDDFAEQASAAGMALQYPLVYGLLTRALELDREESLGFMACAVAAGMVSTAVKTIPLSQLAGQRILASVHSSIAGLPQRSEQLTEADLGLGFPGADIASMQHESLYSRLYMS